MIIRQKHITRAEVRERRNRVYVFGDNMNRQGKAGQAAEMRGEPNTIGVPTKHLPSNVSYAYFRDEDWKNPRIRNTVIAALDDIKTLLYEEVEVVIPADGLGTGLAQLPEKAPVIHTYIEQQIKRMERIFGVKHED